MTQKVVSIFGSAAIPADHPDYRAAEEVGRLLAQSGYAVLTGGYGGIMEAASKGAKVAGGHVIGVTAALFEGPGKRSGPNPYVGELIRYDSLRDRLHHVVEHCDAAVAMPGGIGTLAEIALMWSYMQTHEIPRRPLVLYGELWNNTLSMFYGEGQYIKPENMNLWQIAHTPQQVLEALQAWPPA
jgi:hypothetical protein